MTRTLIFDLDGTLIDSNSECVAILQEMLKERGFDRTINPVLSAPYMSLGGAAMVAALLGGACTNANDDLDEFRARYAQRTTPPDSLFEGVETGLKALKDAGYQLAICTNKPANLCQKVLSDTSIAEYFSVIVGMEPGLQPKPAPDLLLRVLAETGAAPAECLFIGDSELDEAIAATCSIPFLHMRYGYGGSDWIPRNCAGFDHFADLVEHLFLADQNVSR